MSKRILFVCTGNAGRSQMAEAMFRSRTVGKVEVLSAGVEPWDDLHPMARKLMTEQELDLTGHHPKHVRKFVDEDFDVVVTIGDRAESESPNFRTGVRRLHWPVADPADADGTSDSEAVFRATCARIEAELGDLGRLLGAIPERTESAWVPAVSTTVFRPGAFHPAEHVPMLVAAGFRHIELCCYLDSDFQWEKPAAVTDLKQVAADHGLTVLSVHPPDRGVLASDRAGPTTKIQERTAIDSGPTRRTRHHLARVIDRMRLIGIPVRTCGSFEAGCAERHVRGVPCGGTTEFVKTLTHIWAHPVKRVVALSAEPEVASEALCAHFVLVLMCFNVGAKHSIYFGLVLLFFVFEPVCAFITCRFAG